MSESTFCFSQKWELDNHQFSYLFSVWLWLPFVE